MSFDNEHYESPSREKVVLDVNKLLQVTSDLNAALTDPQAYIELLNSTGEIKLAVADLIRILEWFNKTSTAPVVNLRRFA